MKKKLLNSVHPFRRYTATKEYSNRQTDLGIALITALFAFVRELVKKTEVKNYKFRRRWYYVDDV